MTLENISLIGAIIMMALVIVVRMVTIRILERTQETIRQLCSESHQRTQDYKRRRFQREMVDQKRLALLRRKVAMRNEMIAFRKEIEDLEQGKMEQEQRIAFTRGLVEFSREEVAELLAQQT